MLEKKGAKKGVIFCIHGNSSSSKIFKYLLSSEKNDFSIIATDLPGHGNNRNKNQREEHFTLASYRAFLLNRLSDIEENIIIIGNSLGGHLAIEIAPELPNLKGLVLMGTPPVKKPLNFEEAWIPNEDLNTFLMENPTKENIATATAAALHDQSHQQLLIENFQRTDSRVRKVFASELMGGNTLDQFNIFSQLTIPKFIIAGKQDPSVNRAYLTACQHASFGKCEIIDVDNCGHYPIDVPLLFNEIIDEIALKVLL